jgi:hypothetical protein
MKRSRIGRILNWRPKQAPDEPAPAEEPAEPAEEEPAEPKPERKRREPEDPRSWSAFKRRSFGVDRGRSGTGSVSGASSRKLSGERLHQRATEILQEQGVAPETATAEQYRQAAEQAQAEGIPYERVQPTQTLADLDRQLEEERAQLLVEVELSRLGVTLETASAEQLHDAVEKASEVIEAAKKPTGPIEPISPILPIRQPKTEEGT